MYNSIQSLEHCNTRQIHLNKKIKLSMHKEYAKNRAAKFYKKCCKSFGKICRHSI